MAFPRRVRAAGLGRHRLRPGRQRINQLEFRFTYRDQDLYKVLLEERGQQPLDSVYAF